MRKIEMIPWTKEWERLYSTEEKLLKDIFKKEIVDIFHIGSTSIQQIGYAKPIIDILMVVQSIGNIDVYTGEMQSLGYDSRGENGIAGRRYFSKGKDKRTHHIHIYQLGNEQIDKHLSLKNYLLNNPKDAKRYGKLKLKLAIQYPENTHHYQKGKDAFVNELVEKSLQWSKQNQKR